jgi:predicted nucleotidyltransferase
MMAVHCYTSQDAWNAVICAAEEIKKSNLATKLYSVVLYGSLVRGDFVDNVSDIDSKCSRA